MRGRKHRLAAHGCGAAGWRSERRLKPVAADTLHGVRDGVGEKRAGEQPGDIEIPGHLTSSLARWYPAPRQLPTHRAVPGITGRDAADRQHDDVDAVERSAPPQHPPGP